MFPLDKVESYLRGFAQDLVRRGDKLEWTSGDGVTGLSVETINHETSDGLLVSERVVLSHASPMLAGFSPAFAAHLNKWAALSAFVPASASEPARLVCKVGIFNADAEAAEVLYAPLIAMEAAIVGWHAARVARGQFRAPPESRPLSMTDQVPSFEDSDFEALKAVTDERGFVGTLGERHFTVEFPWDAGAVSNMFASDEAKKLLGERGVPEEELSRVGGLTSLLQIQQTEHPLYGAGIQSKLEIPMAFEGNKGVNLVDELNRWEVSGDDLPPLFGAWCLGDRAPAFVSFLPTQFCFPGLLRNLLVWGLARHGHVRQWLKADITRVQ